MHPILFHIGSLKLSFYGLMLATSFFVGMHLVQRWARAEGVSSKKMEWLSWWVIVSAILGARLLYMLAEQPSYFFRHPWKFFAFQEGGLHFFGGLLLAVGASVLYCRKHRLPFFKVADIFAPTIALGLSLTKIGCFMAGCCFGKVCDLPWGVSFTHPETLAYPRGVPLHPTQLYESAANLGIFFLLLFSRRFRRFEGEILFLFLVVYGIVRFYLETFRNEPIQFAGLTMAQLIIIPMVLLAIFGWWKLRDTRLDPN